MTGWVINHLSALTNWKNLHACVNVRSSGGNYWIKSAAVSSGCGAASSRCWVVERGSWVDMWEILWRWMSLNSIQCWVWWILCNRWQMATWCDSLVTHKLKSNLHTVFPLWISVIIFTYHFSLRSNQTRASLHIWYETHCLPQMDGYNLMCKMSCWCR